MDTGRVQHLAHRRETAVNRAMLRAAWSVVQIPSHQKQDDSEGEYEAVEHDYSGDAGANAEAGDEKGAIVGDHVWITREAASPPRRSRPSL